MTQVRSLSAISLRRSRRNASYSGTSPLSTDSGMQFIRKFFRISSSVLMPPYRSLPPLHCSTNCLKYHGRGLVADGYVHFALSQHEVCDLVIPATLKASLFEVVLRENVMQVTMSRQKLTHQNIA